MSAELVNEYSEYTEKAIENFVNCDNEMRYALVDAAADLKIRRVLDLGCGAGQELLPFLEHTEALRVGVDAARDLASAGGKVKNLANDEIAPRLEFVRAFGEELPFEDESFDVVLCLVALPYMNNRRTIAEVSRILRKGGKFLLKIHAPQFYFGMIPARIKTLKPKNVAYPLICLAGSVWHQVSEHNCKKVFGRARKFFKHADFSKGNLPKTI